ncbi:MAG: hypothetical protein JEZ12_23530 [Desulfobacterium sp.]|nr:hypothetical protein [Desulfobacterium sp.]
MNYAEAKAYAMTKLFDLETGAVEVFYNGSETSIPAVIEYGGGGNFNADHGTITVQVTDVPSPSYRDTFTVGGVVWRIVRDPGKGNITRGNGDTWLIEISSKERFGGIR